MPQSGVLANRQLSERLEKERYYEARTTPGLWRHKWRPIQFCLEVDDFVVEYVRKNMQIIWQPYLKNTILSQKTGKARSMMALI